MAGQAPAGKRYFPAYYSDYPVPSDVYILQCTEGIPFAETKLRSVVVYPTKASFPVPRVDVDKYFCLQGYVRRPEDCSVFEQPYFTPSYLPMPVNYNTKPPHWRDSRITKDWLANWGNENIRNDRAFGKWHAKYGTQYLYHDNRRL